jgi:hypothetical protein
LLHIAIALLSLLSFNTTPSPAVILDPKSPYYDEAAVSEVFEFKGLKYRRKKTIARSIDPRKEQSLVWQYGETIVRQDNKKEVYYCYQCERNKSKQNLPVMSGTTAGRNHLKSHNIDPDTRLPLVKEVVKGAILEVVTKKDKATFKALLIR